MTIPKSNYNPPFNVTRASHAVLTVKDLGKSRAFYVDLIDFIVSYEDKDTIYLRGVAEACHHSLVLKRAAVAQAERVGRRRQAALAAAGPAHNGSPKQAASPASSRARRHIRAIR